METSSLVMLILFSFIFSITLCYVLFRWIFSIKRQLWNQKQQINLLIKIAEKLGVPKEEVELIENKNNNKNAYLD
ncbi:MAG TPA: hypothetical protein VFS36_15915 [Chitinophagaceae bacterium]|jgi:hypothetical protein|nr:hypothetical protein [Chitinophagaceae bacterium]